MEHVGSVKSVYTDENRGFVLSGSYDTTVRYTSISNIYRILYCNNKGVASCFACGWVKELLSCKVAFCLAKRVKIPNLPSSAILP